MRYMTKGGVTMFLHVLYWHPPPPRFRLQTLPFPPFLIHLYANSTPTPTPTADPSAKIPSNPPRPPNLCYVVLGTGWLYYGTGARGGSGGYVLVGRVGARGGLSPQAWLHPAALLEKTPQLRSHAPSPDKTARRHAPSLYAGAKIK